MNLVRLNLHYLDPFNNGLRDYEVTDIAYAYLGDEAKAAESRIVIVNSGRPDRARLTAAVDLLSAAGAGAIGLDFYFEEFRRNTTDTLFRRSLINSARTVLACTVRDEDTTDELLDGISGVHPFFSQYTRVGYGNFPSNETKTVRVYSPREQLADGTELPAFTTALLGIYAPEKRDRLLARGRQIEHIDFRSSKNDFINLELDELLDSLSLNEVRTLCQDRIVLIGYATEDPWANQLLDRHYTPLNRSYDTKSIPDMYGVAIHANVLSMVLNERYLRVVPAWLSFLISVLICYGNVVLFRYIYRRFNQPFHGMTRLIQFVEFLLLFFLVTLLFHYFRLKIDLRVGILSVLLAYDFIMIYQSLVLPRSAYLRSPHLPFVSSSNTIAEEE